MKIKKIDGKSRNPQKELGELLKKNFPEIFAEGKIDCQKLKRTLGEDVEANGERYGLSWAGKGDCFRHIQEPTTKTLKPAKDESVDFENTGNLFIEGENLEVLKVLQKSYYGKVKAIYIDPPYNTGNDSFIYPDRFQESQDEYLRRIGDKDEEGNLTKEGMFRKNSKDSGHYHSNWLSMMYPRLFLARNLLRQDGVIFVSIDDNEVHNLRMIMNEIFGEENFVGELVVIRAEGGGLAKQIIKGHDYLIIYARSIEELDPLKKPKDIRGKIIEKNGIKYWLEEDWLRKEFGKYGTCAYDEIEKYKGKEKKQEIDEGIKNGLYQIIEKNGKKIVARLREINKDGTKFYSIIKHLSANGVRDLEKLELGKYFDFPKPISLIKELAKGATLFTKNEGDIILDFFTGSGTMAQAVIELNADDGGNRKYICVQLAEACDEESEAFKAGYKTIADIAKERIRRAGKKIEEEVSEKRGHLNGLREVYGYKKGEIKELQSDMDAPAYDFDFGFKVLKLDDSNFKIWNGNVKDPEELEKQMLEFVDNVKKESTAENMLYELLLKSGLDPNVSVEKKKANGGIYYSVDEGKLIVHLEGKISKELVEAILKAKPEKMICLDRAFGGNDQLKTNTALSMESAKIDFRVV